MPRLDLFRSLHPGLDAFHTAGISVDPQSAEDPYLHSYRSGFWGTVRIAPADSPTRELELWAELESGAQASQSLASLEAVHFPDPVRSDGPAPGEGPFVAICMATYSPPMDLLPTARSSRSALRPTRRWVCVDQRRLLAPGALRGDARRAGRGWPRFVVSRSPRRLGFYRNFERALSMVPRRGRNYVALADQDDHWHPDKLATLLARDRRRPARLQRRPRDRSRRQRHLATRTGPSAATTTRLSVAARGELGDRRRIAVPPRRCSTTRCPSRRRSSPTSTITGSPLVALALRRDRVHRAAAVRLRPARQALRSAMRLRTGCLAVATASGALKRDPRERVALWRRHYFVDVCRLMQLRDDRPDALRPTDGAGDKRRTLERFLRAGRARSPGLAALWRARRPRAPGPAPRNARRGVDAGLRVQPGAGCSRPAIRDRPVKPSATRRGSAPELAPTPGRVVAAQAAATAADLREDRRRSSSRCPTMLRRASTC